MEAAFLKSDIHARMMAEKDKYKQLLASDNAARDEFYAAVTEQK